MPSDENIIIHIPTEEDESEKLRENIANPIKTTMMLSLKAVFSVLFITFKEADCNLIAPLSLYLNDD